MRYIVIYQSVPGGGWSVYMGDNEHGNFELYKSEKKAWLVAFDLRKMYHKAQVASLH